MSVQLNINPSPFEQPIIVAENVTKTYRTGNIQVQALGQIDLTIQRGEMVAIMGPSGCGKTTLLNCLSGLDDFDAGEVRIEAESLRKMSDRKRTTYRAQRMGFIFQTFNLLPVLTAVENVELPLLVSGTRPSAARKRALEALEQVGLGDRTTHRPAELSGGQRQRVTIARSLVNDPAIIWADEPTGNLDSKTTNDILAIMRQLNQEQERTFVIVTHTTEVSDWCDRIIQMSDGEIVDDGRSLAAQFEKAGRDHTHSKLEPTSVQPQRIAKPSVELVQAGAVESTTNDAQPDPAQETHIVDGQTSLSESNASPFLTSPSWRNRGKLARVNNGGDA